MKEFTSIAQEIKDLIQKWESMLLELSNETITQRRNDQSRTIKQIIGHMVDSASNNTHRIIHLQYQESPLIFPDYANFGNNDKWIAIQNYQEEDWQLLVQLWKYSNQHICHVMENVNEDKLENEWLSGKGQKITLRAMILDFPRHFKLHLTEIKELIDRNQD